MKNITINYEYKKINITNTFAKRAGVVGSSEYNMLVNVRREFPDYALHVNSVSRQYNPSPYSRLTYAYMEATIMKCDNAEKREEWLEELEKRKFIRGFFEAKKWFIQTVLSNGGEVA